LPPPLPPPNAKKCAAIFDGCIRGANPRPPTSITARRVFALIEKSASKRGPIQVSLNRLRDNSASICVTDIRAAIMQMACKQAITSGTKAAVHLERGPEGATANEGMKNMIWGCVRHGAVHLNSDGLQTCPIKLKLTQPDSPMTGIGRMGRIGLKVSAVYGHNGGVGLCAQG
jgi:hypothetical protein